MMWIQKDGYWLELDIRYLPATASTYFGCVVTLNTEKYTTICTHAYDLTRNHKL